MEEFYRIKRLPPYVFETVNRAKAAARNADADIVDLGMGNPDLPAPAHVIEKIKESSMGLYDRVQPRINGIGYGDTEKYNDGMFGTAGQIFVLRLDCSWPVLTPLLQPFFDNGTYRFTVAATMRNEAF